MSTTLPNDPVILVSYLNTQLRDHYASLKELCDSLCVNQDEICTKLAGIDYHYNADNNQFQ